MNISSNISEVNVGKNSLKKILILSLVDKPSTCLFLHGVELRTSLSEHSGICLNVVRIRTTVSALGCLNAVRIHTTVSSLGCLLVVTTFCLYYNSVKNN
jgi:hypothetical protein